VQILHLLKSPKDAWTRVVRKVANDVVHRIFGHLKNEEISSDQKLTKELFIQCFQKGKSTTQKLKGMTNWGDTHVGREILVINTKEEIEKVFTSHLFNKPIPVAIRDNQYFSIIEESERSIVHFRHSFDHELLSCVHQLNCCSEVNEFTIVDQRQTLLKIKEEIEEELVYKFMSNNEKIISTLREVFIEELDNKLTASFEKTDKKIEQVNDQVGQVSDQVGQVSDQVEQVAQHAEQVADGQRVMLEQIYMRLKKMEAKVIKIEN
jgi:hypothetical protein